DVVNVEDQKIKIGLSFDSFVIERWQRDRDVFVSTAIELGADVNVQNANGNPEEQKAQIEYFIQENMDVIVIIAVDSENCKDVLLRAKNEGIKVIAYDRLLINTNVDLYISFDNEEVGKIMGESLAENIPNGGNIVTIFGSPSDNNVKLVEEGFSDAIVDKGFNIVYSLYAENWLAEEAFRAINEALLINEDINGVLCGNDNLASQAVRALSENRLAGKVVVTGQDADLAACQRIVEGTQTMTVYKPVDELAKKAAEYAVKLGKHEDIKVYELINDGKFDVPYVRLEPVAVNIDNIDDVIIGGGFQQKEDVYLYVPES
ncbi:MAG TPA: sugar ABC transporter substrate-binding protein, partial [Clostridiales bacterium]|nr:sugar ABC transporter substrate-binding protein [Clostridiales bacterium]